MTILSRTLLFFLLLLPAAANAQTPAAPAGPTAAAPGPLPLSLADAVARGLAHNVNALVAAARVTAAGAVRDQSRSALLPHLSADVRETTQVSNLAAFGFSGFGDFPNLIGPFNVFDARLDVTASLIDVAARNDLRADAARATAAGADDRHVREAVTLGVAKLYLEAQADRARVAAARAQVTTAEALVQLATDQKASGLVAGIDVLRQQVQLESARAALIDANNDLEKRKLLLGRAIGLPATQTIELTTSTDYRPVPPMTIDTALAQAAGHRSDLNAATARADAARLDTRAARAATLPSLRVHADVGALGTDVGSSLRTYSVAATVHIPVFEGGRTQARVAEQDAIAREREAEAADLREGVAYDVRAALLDLDAAAASVAVAESRVRLAREELTQAEDRFRAGVAGSIELVQAQDAVAGAAEREIATVLAHNIAKAGLARALGNVETRFVEWIGGQQ